jgi:hypothetical protein
LNHKNTGEKFAVYSPGEFIGCYFHAQEIHEIHSVNFDNYSSVSNYSLKYFSKSDPSSWLRSQYSEYLLNNILHTIPRQFFHMLPAYLKADYKARKFLFKTGIYKNIKQIAQLNHNKFLGTGQYVNLASMEKLDYDIHNFLNIQFKNLRLMILDGALQNSVDRESHTMSWVNSLSQNDEHYLQFESMLNFISDNEKTIYIRTRNIPGSASAHNTNIGMLKSLISTLLQNNFKVINSGTPTFLLEINNPRYLEISHNLPVVVQQFLASKCLRTVTSAEAGLFTAWAATDIPLITFGQEWSITNLPEKISLLEARSKLGILDSSIEDGQNTELIRNVFDSI